MNAKKLFKLAKKGDVSILSDPDCSVIKKMDGWTPLHWLAWHGKLEVLSHKDCSVVRTNKGVTPLQLLAVEGKIEVLNHPDCAAVKDNDGKTPIHGLVCRRAIKPQQLKQIFPWYQRKRKGKITEKEIDEILNTPNAIKYILED